MWGTAMLGSTGSAVLSWEKLSDISTRSTFMEKLILDRATTALVLVDIQERLVPAMGQKDTVISNCQHLIEAAKLMNIPTLLTEQYPKGLGTTIPEIRDALASYAPIVKTTFSCYGESTFVEELIKTGRKTVLLAGMETHVCVLQTALDLMNNGFAVHLVKDAACSRTEANCRTGVEFMRDAGAVITCTETVLFQLLKAAGTDEFKTIAKRIK
jgi:nicotinamidase-related amidase